MNTQMLKQNGAMQPCNLQVLLDKHLMQSSCEYWGQPSYALTSNATNHAGSAIAGTDMPGLGVRYGFSNDFEF
jgi:hypothetical protein